MVRGTSKRVVVLGGGTGGTMVANRLRRRYREHELEIVVVDRDDDHVYQPGLLFVPFGMTDPDGIVRSRREQLRPGVDFRLGEVDHVDTAESAVTLADGSTLVYDVLVVATGARLQPEETEGLTGPGWGERVFTFYDLEGARSLAAALERFQEGRLVVDVVDMPIKCPVAPLEFAFLADWHFRERGLRDRIEIVFATPLDGAFTRPMASRELGGLLRAKDIELVTEFNAGLVDGAAGRLVGYDDRELSFDLLVAVPLHGGQPWVERSPGLGDALGFVPTDPETLQSLAAENVFALGDATNVPTSKAGSVTHFECDALTENVQRFLDGDELVGAYDGHANCFVETGFGKALLIDFNYDVEPLPGHYPAALGLPLLKESRLNHLAKLLFERIYWRVLLPGHDVPGLSATLPSAGKRGVPAAADTRGER